MSTCEHQWVRVDDGAAECLRCGKERVVIGGVAYAIDDHGYLHAWNQDSERVEP